MRWPSYQVRRLWRAGSLRGTLARLVAAVGAALAILIVVGIVGSVLTASEYRDGSVLAVKRQNAANQILVDLLNAETGNRGYILTGAGAYRLPYTLARARYPADLARLRRLLRNEPPLVAAVDYVNRTAQLWFDEARVEVRLRRQGRVQAAIARVNEGTDQQRLDSFRNAHRALIDEVQRVRRGSLSTADQRRDFTVLLISAAAALALLVTAVVARQLWRRMGVPVANLAEGVRRVGGGDFSEEVPASPGAVRELARLTSGFNEMQRDLETQREAAAAAARREAAQQTERRMWETVQRGLLPAGLPTVAGLRLAARYQAAEPSLLIGGDFYDGVTLADGRVAVVVGDLSGSGAQAAARAAGLRFGWRTLVAVDPEPSLVMPALNAQLSGSEERSEGVFASLCYALIDPTTGTVDLALAGHPPPLLVTTETAGVVGGDEPGPLLGVMDDAAWPAARTQIPPGGTLLVYTDGLVEARRGIDLFGAERACAVLWENRRSPLEERLARLVDAARRHDTQNLRDDVVVLAVERPVAVAVEGQETDLEAAPTPR
jgi:serine phosphatase RsbU (regulator of sigma subunit)/CHASE3 domain sensor protein